MTCEGRPIMNVRAINISAIWDDEAAVWVATSEDVPGLATEAASSEELESKLCKIIPVLLELNRATPVRENPEVPLDLLLHQEKSLRFQCS